ncbi:uncharacterized protein LOC143451981 isoform X1 [Clavelina lepadiformis]|uniref:uncharacterized protein LOC143451981 isoform X1 n=3 Tax=Clavelina lepadiformis TaxID=159417 RepID=UPI004041D5DB
MMLIPQSLGMGHNDSHKPGFFTNQALSSPSVATASVSSEGHPSVADTAQAIGCYPAGDSYLLPGRMQPEFPNINMHSAQPGSSALTSPASYGPVPAAVAPGPGIMTPQYGSPPMEHSPYYPPLGSGYDGMKPGSGEIWGGSYPQAPASYYPGYENAFGPSYYDRYPMDVCMNDGVRRKNATRESTNTLKAWLQEHKKNPYPTKGEKIMLAIITKMTLTQVSTWFANARRRLKKENKMTWVPKNRSNDSTNGSNDKKADDDDEQSVDIDSKTDIDQSADSDDSGDREVTSTNNNDVMNEDYMVDGKSTPFPAPNDTDTNPQTSTEYTASNTPPDVAESKYTPSDEANSAIWTPTNENKVGYQAENRLPHDTRPSSQGAFYQEFPDERYTKPPAAMSKSSSELPREAEEESRASNDCRYTQPWNDGSYNSPPAHRGVDSTTHQLANRGAEEERTVVIGASPSSSGHQFATTYQHDIHVSGGGRFPGKTDFISPEQGDGLPGVSGSTVTRCSAATSPYMRGYPQLTPPPCHANQPNNFYGAERLPPPPALGHSTGYYPPQQDLNQPHENAPQPGHLHANYIPGADIIQTRTSTMVGGATHSPGSTTSPVPRPLYHSHNQGNFPSSYYGSATISSALGSQDALYSSTYYRQDGRGMPGQVLVEDVLMKSGTGGNIASYPRYGSVDGGTLDRRASPRD